MLDLSRPDAKLDTLHQRFLDDALPDDLTRRAFADFDPRRYDDEALARGRRAWQLRALDEYRSQVAFTELLAELTELGVPFDALGVAVRVVRDEARHVELCRRMVVALGGSEKIEHDPRWVRSNKKLPVRARVVRTIAGSLCIGETLSVRMLAAVRDRAEDPLAHAVLTCLVSDESVHGRFGWLLFEHLLPGLDATERERLEALLPRWIISAEEAFVPKSIRTGRPDLLISGPRMPFGSVADAERARVFTDHLEHDVLRRFDALGFKQHRSWSTHAARKVA